MKFVINNGVYSNNVFEVGNGFGDGFEQLRGMFEIVSDSILKGSFDLLKSKNLKKQDLASLANEESEIGEAISSNSITDALRFLELFPENATFDLPEISDDGRNGVSFEWRGPRGYVFIIVFKGDGKYVFAGLAGKGEMHGTESLQAEEIPQFIIEAIRRVGVVKEKVKLSLCS